MASQHNPLPKEEQIAAAKYASPTPLGDIPESLQRKADEAQALGDTVKADGNRILKDIKNVSDTTENLGVGFLALTGSIICARISLKRFRAAWPGK